VYFSALKIVFVLFVLAVAQMDGRPVVQKSDFVFGDFHLSDPDPWFKEGPEGLRALHVVAHEFRVGAPEQVDLQAGDVVAVDYGSHPQQVAFSRSSRPSEEDFGSPRVEYFALFWVQG